MKRDKLTSFVKQPLTIDDTWTDKLAVVKSISKILQSTQGKSIGNFSFLLVGGCQLIELTLRESFTTSISGHRADGIRPISSVFLICLVLFPRFTTEVTKCLGFASFAHVWRSLLVQLLYPHSASEGSPRHLQMSNLPAAQDLTSMVTSRWAWIFKSVISSYYKMK